MFVPRIYTFSWSKPENASVKLSDAPMHLFRENVYSTGIYVLDENLHFSQQFENSRETNVSSEPPNSVW